MITQTDSTKPKRQSYLWLLLGTILLIFSNGNWIIPLATWLAPIFLLRFVHTQKPGRGLLIFTFINIVVFIIAWQGMIPAPLGIYFLIAIGYGVLQSLTYVTDRLLTPRIYGFAKTLVFPLAWVTIEHFSALISPYTSWGSLAYTQYDHLPLIQVVAVLGLAGPTFLITWFASVINWAWGQDFKWPQIQSGVGLYTSILTSILLLGGARVNLFPPASDTVRVGALTTSPQMVYYDTCVAGRDIDFACTQKISDALLSDLLEHSRQAAQTGAKIVVWQEDAVFLLEEAEATAIEQGQNLARQEKIYLGMTFFTVTRTYPNDLGENKVVWIAPSGEVLTEFLKARPVPGDDDLPGDGHIPILNTPYGKIASTICYDMDFPNLIYQAGKAHADLMFVSANDGRDISPLHTRMAILRGVENGFSVVRATSYGLSTAADYQGRVLASLDDYTTEERLLIADVPTRGVTTLYSQIGDLFAWLCVTGLAVIVGWNVIQGKKGNSVFTSTPGS